jgi:hypothetical protein
VEITAGIKNEWVRVERDRKVRAARRGKLFGHVRTGVRRIFIFLFVATLSVFALNHYTEIESVASAKLHQVVRKSLASEKLRQSAVNYENQVDDITK